MSRSIIKTMLCRRCGGRLALESDVYGTYIQCIQCGASYSEKDVRSMIAGAKEKALNAHPAGDRQTSV